jgi:hypothetical protein
VKCTAAALICDADPDQQLIVHTAEPGSRSEQALREFAAWAAEIKPVRWDDIQQGSGTT